MTPHEALAQLVAGEPVKVDFIAPRDKTFLGLTYRGLDGGLRIEVHPGLSDRDRFELFIHECAHCALHGGRLEAQASEVDLSYAELIEAARLYAPDLAESLGVERDRIESEADSLARSWSEFVERVTGEGASTETKIDCLVDALLAGDVPLA